MKFWRPDTAIYFDERPVDRDDPEAARNAIEYGLPTGFSDKAKRFWKYLEGAAFIFSYYANSMVMRTFHLRNPMKKNFHLEKFA